MERLGCAWLEEPLWRYNFDGLAKLNEEVDIPIAGGEINIGIPDFKIMLEKGCYEILQPNCTMSTGISYIRKIAALADSYGKTVNPHAYIPGTGVFAEHAYGCVDSELYLAPNTHMIRRHLRRVHFRDSVGTLFC